MNGCWAVVGVKCGGWVAVGPWLGRDDDSARCGAWAAVGQ